MAGKIIKMVNLIIEKRAKGSEIIAKTTKAKLVLSGIALDNYNETSADDEDVLAKLREIANNMGLEINL
ncbi:MAG: hypothetical protein JM58_05810 [Peptococcaceae bacterium BICA1-8]|nr:MAG: hypothetical protein JM58_05810 [Peptococcaceae bacterium BICA1-8]